MLDVAMYVKFSLALPDRFFLRYGDGEKGLVNSLYHFCSTDSQFLGIVNWVADSNRQRLFFIDTNQRPAKLRISGTKMV